jgi:carbamoyl-phosphate synthase large subunit
MKLLITGIGGDIAQGVASIIRECRPEVEILGADMGTKHAGYLYASKVFKVPSASSEEYIDTIKELMLNNSIDIVIPLTEPELSVFSPLISELTEDRCITAGHNVIAKGIDKLETIKAISDLGLSVPWSIDASYSIPSEYPCIFKGRRGSGSKNVFIVKNKEEAEFLAKKYPVSIFQELLEPAEKEVTCAVYRNRNGQVAVLQLLRRLMGGLTGWAEVVGDPDTLEMCRIIAEGLNLRGSMNVQLKITNTGPKVFEINPRFSSTALMRHRLGFSDVLWALDEAIGLEVKYPEIELGQRMVRVYDAKKI